jgi:hypothetical protein
MLKVASEIEVHQNVVKKKTDEVLRELRDLVKKKQMGT